MNTFTAIDVDYSLTKMRCATLTATTATNTGENPSTANANNAQTLSGSFTAERMGEGVGGLNLHPAGKYNSR